MSLRMLRLPCLALLLALAGCGRDEALSEVGAGDAPWEPPPETCVAPSLDAPETFTECSTGSGIFGRWTLDDLGLPAYDYRLDQHADARARYPVSEQDLEGQMLDRREHWAAFGNHRVNAHFFNDGMIEVVTQDRGVEHLNKVDESQQAFGGGFGWLSDGTEAWSTAYKWRPADAGTTRRFGMGYAEASTTYRGVRALRRTTAPPGTSPVVVSEITLENLGAEPKTLAHWEYWDVARRPIEINWIVSGSVFTLAPQSARDTRDARNALFDEAPSWDAALHRLSLRRSWGGSEPRPERDQPSALDAWPHEPFLAAPLGEVSDLWVDQTAFFGSGGAALPDAVAQALPGAGLDPSSAVQNGAGQPHAFVMKSEVTLAPGESKTLRFVFGYARSEEPFPSQPEWSDPDWDPRLAATDELGPHLLHFAADDHPELQRELAWHAYQMETSVGWRDYWQGPVVPQGSAYLYLHGADGAARDLGLFALPLVYTHPELARAELRLYMGIQLADGRFSYAFQGHGMLDDASIHSAPSDLPLFFLWALGEYLGATGDLGFLNETAPYWPRDARPDARVWNHLVDALRHQFDVVGTGEHGLIRMQTGDWSDGIVQEAPNRELAVAKGESVPNTQMAVAILPRIADLVEERDAALASEIRERIVGYRAALSQHAWNGEHYVRCYFGDGKPRYDSTINLEAQIWGLIGETLANDADRDALIAKIAAQLDDPSPIGATLWPGGQVWPAISAPLTWGYALSDPERAWAHFTRNTLAAHAQAFPEVWYGIWSGPDGVGSDDGLAWKSQVTPMTDFPVQNANAHAMPLLAALRIAGIEASAEGVELVPRVPARALSLRTALFEVDQRGGKLSGAYRPSGSSHRVLRVHAPKGASIASATANGETVAVPSGSTVVSLSHDPTASPELRFEVVLSP